MQYPRDSNRKVVTIFGPEGVGGGRVDQNPEGNRQCREGQLERREAFAGKELGEQISVSSLPIISCQKIFIGQIQLEARRKESTLVQSVQVSLRTESGVEEDDVDVEG